MTDMFTVNARQADALMEQLLVTFTKEDRYYYFEEPVHVSDAPDYYDVILHPMDLQTVRLRRIEGKYDRNVDAFLHDLFLITDNAMIYNPESHHVNKEARRVRTILVEALHTFINRLCEKKRLSPIHIGDMEMALILSNNLFHGRNV